MFRAMSIATLVMIAVCFLVGAGLALADEGVQLPTALSHGQEDASVPVESLFDENLAQNDRDRDTYDFSDYTAHPSASVSEAPVDSVEIEEPDLQRFEKMDC